MANLVVSNLLFILEVQLTAGLKFEKVHESINAQWLRNMSLTSGKIFENFSALILGLGYTHK